jgi:hypothetical protein
MVRDKEMKILGALCRGQARIRRTTTGTKV